MRAVVLLVCLAASGCIEEARAANAGSGQIGNGAIGGQFGGGFAVPAGGVSETFPAQWLVSGTPMTVVLDCEARGITGTDWACNTGGTFAEASTGTAPTTGQATDYTIPEAAEGVLYAAGKVHASASTSVADIGTDDFVLEIVYKSHTGVGTKVLASKGDSSDDGWEFLDHYPASTQVGLIGGNGVNGFVATSSVSFSDDTWYHVVFFRDNSDTNTSTCGRFFKNGATLTSTISNCRAGETMSNARAPVIGADAATFAFKASNTIALVRVFKCAGCLPGGATNITAIQTEAAAHYTLLTAP
jgi:Concanavalin A-like lectin/glucanases superfamily